MSICLQLFLFAYLENTANIQKSPSFTHVGSAKGNPNMVRIPLELLVTQKSEESKSIYGPNQCVTLSVLHISVNETTAAVIIILGTDTTVLVLRAMMS